MRTDLPMTPGDVVAGRFHILEVIDRGGFATVYRARQESLGRNVALKVLRTDDADPADDEHPIKELVERFRREAKVISRLTHPATVTLYDFGQTRTDDFYMVLEYVDGIALHRLFGRKFAPTRVVDLLQQALGSLKEAHEHGVIHRDIKPSNLMLYKAQNFSDRLKILDFGIAKLLEPTDGDTIRGLTDESVLVGTPRYLAPENATGRNPGPPADIYSLGLVAYELLVGEKAVTGDDPMSILDRHLATDFQPVLEKRPGIPESLRRIVNKMIRKPLDERYPDAETVTAKLDELPSFGREYNETESLTNSSSLGPAFSPENDTPTDHPGESTTHRVVSSERSGSNDTHEVEWRASGSTNCRFSLRCEVDADHTDDADPSALRLAAERPRPTTGRFASECRDDSGKFAHSNGDDMHHTTGTVRASTTARIVTSDGDTLEIETRKAETTRRTRHCKCLARVSANPSALLLLVCAGLTVAFAIVIIAFVTF